MNTPFLPKNRIKACIIGEGNYNEIKELTELGVKCISIPKVKSLDDEISCHADLLAFNCGNGNLLAESSIAGELQSKLSHYVKIISVEGIESPYPNDIGLNVFFDGRNLFCNLKYVNQELKIFCVENDIEIIHTNQGYTKCSICAVSDSAIITEDDGLASLLKKYQYDVLKIKKGFIGLSDKHYGFIGGASVKISDNELYVSGDIAKHPDYSLIKDFCHKYDVSLIYNQNRPLNDFGGIVTII